MPQDRQETILTKTVQAAVSRIAHRINNDLMAIAVHAELLSGHGLPESVVASSVAEILMTCKAASAWLDRINAAARKDVTAALAALPDETTGHNQQTE